MHPTRRLALALAVIPAALTAGASDASAEPPRPRPAATAPTVSLPAKTAPAAPAGVAAGASAGTPPTSSTEGAAPSGEPMLRQESKYAFEFSKAEVQDIVKAISDMTKQNFIIPERIKGQRITILCPNKVTANEAYQVFYTALAANGISIVRVGRFYKLLDSKDAIKDSVPTCTEVDGQQQCNLTREQMVTVLLRMRYVDAAQVNTVARALLSKDGDITVFQPSNALIISEYAPNLRRVRRIIESLDVAGFDDALQIVPIHHASATEVSDKLTQIFDIGQNGRPGGIPPAGRRGSPVSVPQPGQEDGDVQISKIVPDDRTNQLIIKANRRSFDAIKHLISKIDVPISEAEHGRVHVYYLENAKAEDLSSTLSNLAQGSAPKDGRRGPGAPNLPPGANKNATTALFEGEVKITADKATNSLLVMSSGHDYRALRALIEKLDVARRQVYVEAAILEINIKDSEQFNLDYLAPKNFKDGQLGPLPSNGAIGFLQAAQTGTAASTFGALQDAGSFVGVAGGALAGVLGPPINIPIGSNGQVFAVPSFGLILKWLQTSSHANVLSTPHILTTDNEEARIEVGEMVPFNTGLGGSSAAALGSLAGGAGGAGLGALGGLGALTAFSNNVQRIPVSLKLNLTPQINERNKIRLEIDQQVEDLVGSDAKSPTPTTSKRNIKTVVVVDNQQTIVLGGLIKNTQIRAESRIPYLGSIPILGWLFKKSDVQQQKTNLLLVLTPYIISSSDDFQRIFERKMSEHEEFAAEFYGHRPEYRAHIDYQKKSGPLGRLVSTLRREQGKYENGGRGDGSESMVGPEGEDAAAVDSNLDTAPVGLPAKASAVTPSDDAERAKDADADADENATGRTGAADDQQGSP